jgi:hypothetical protein
MFRLRKRVEIRTMKPWILFSLVATLAAVALAIQLSPGSDPEVSPDPAPPSQETSLFPSISHEATASEVLHDAAPWMTIQNDCTSDCSGFEVGYRWAAAQQIEDAEECAGYSEAFSEGCWIYAKEREDIQRVVTASNLGAEASFR